MENPIVLIETNEGDIFVELYPEVAPLSVANFLQYVDESYYDETVFHRIERGFVIQGGGYNRRYERKTPHSPIKNEATNGLSNELGTIAMAREEAKDSATDQFFINAADNSELDHEDDSDVGYGYAVFGRVIDGQKIVKKINWKIIDGDDEFPKKPKDTIVILSISRFE